MLLHLFILVVGFDMLAVGFHIGVKEWKQYICRQRHAN